MTLVVNFAGPVASAPPNPSCCGSSSVQCSKCAMQTLQTVNGGYVNPPEQQSSGQYRRVEPWDLELFPTQAKQPEPQAPTLNAVTENGFKRVAPWDSGLDFTAKQAEPQTEAPTANAITENGFKRVQPWQTGLDFAKKS